jgi:Uma2 family endonuclease
MEASIALARADRPRRPRDQRVFLHGLTWADYERLLEIRGESAVPRMTYLRGVLELMSPSISHEQLKTTVARLLEAWVDEMGIDVNGYGSWTIKDEERKRGLEPDECYVRGAQRPERPELAIEVRWTGGGLSKLEVYRGLGVPEVWRWRKGRIEVHVLRGTRYVRVERSEFVPDLDLVWLAGFLDRPSQSQAVREMGAALRAAKK